MTKHAGRLALRAEGKMWNAYFATMESMEGAVFLGSMPIVFADDPARRKQFMELMQGIVGDVIKKDLGLDVDKWVEGPAPEKDRTKE